MKMIFLSLLVAIVLCSKSTSYAQRSETKGADDKYPVVIMKTNLGAIEITLDAEKAPITVENFLSYVNEKFYDGTIFHRVIIDFMIQGGGYTENMGRVRTKEPIINEADNGLKNERGTIAMARTNVINSATCQFFINLKDNDFLNHKNKSQKWYGYCVFGKVTGGMDVVDKIANVKIRNQGPGFETAPAKPVIIESVRVKE